MKGIVIKNENGYYSVQLEDGKVLSCKVRGRLKKVRYSLLVGDLVLVEWTAEGEGWIETILPRQNSLKRPPVANIDAVILVVAAHHPDINMLLLNRLLVMIEDAEIPLYLCINKWDLHDADTIALAEMYEQIGYEVIRTSSYTGEGIADLKSLLHGKISAFAGPSGVGKSSLLNCIEPSFQFQIGEVSAKIQRGRHTTRHASLYALDENSFIMDTPGFSALDFDDITPTRLPDLFPEFSAYTTDCKFTPCSHTHEPICGVKTAVEAGAIAHSRYTAYVTILEDIQRKG